MGPRTLKGKGLRRPGLACSWTANEGPREHTFHMQMNQSTFTATTFIRFSQGSHLGASIPCPNHPRTRIRQPETAPRPLKDSSRPILNLKTPPPWFLPGKPQQGFYTPRTTPPPGASRGARPGDWQVGGTELLLGTVCNKVSFQQQPSISWCASLTWNNNNNKAYTLTLSQRAGGRQREASFHEGLLVLGGVSGVTSALQQAGSQEAPAGISMTTLHHLAQHLPPRSAVSTGAGPCVLPEPVSPHPASGLVLDKHQVNICSLSQTGHAPTSFIQGPC